MRKALMLLPAILATSLCMAADPSDDGKGIKITPKYFEPTEGAAHGGLGFHYKIDYSLATPTEAKLTDEASFQSFHKTTFDFKAEGNVAFNRDINPTDFLKTGFDWTYAYQYATAVSQGAPGSGCIPTDISTVKKCVEEAQRSKSGDALALFASATGSLESNQSFTKRNGTFGAQVTTVYRPAPGSLINELNPLDWPFRLTRAATKHETGMRPSPDAFPKVRLALERIKPTKDDDRKAILGGVQDYNRVNVEVAATTPVAMVQGRQVKFEWSWRYFKEMNADTRIKDAGLDRYRYTASTLLHDSGWQITYASGRLPLDRQNDKVWELGYRVKLP